MKNFIIALVAILLISCNKEDEVPFVYPLEYLPAYPGSYWTYTNGEKILTNSDYVEHQYLLGVESSEKSDKKRVPVYDGRYLYEYELSQSSTEFPLMKLLEEKAGEPWQINKINGQKIMRKTSTTFDSVAITQLGTADTIWYPEVVEVVEFIDSLGADRWYLKEYYAKNVGLIRTEINDPFDTLPPVIEKELINHHIN